MAETLQQLADRGVQIGPGGQQYSIQSGNTYTPVPGSSPENTTPDALKGLTRSMTLEQAQSQANQAFSGIVAPITLEEIRNREAQARAITAETATSIYNPQISREKQTGGAQVSTAEGVVGQRQGFNISTAEQAFVADTQNKVNDRIKEVENMKASYISQGNMAAADRADAQLQALNEWNTQMTIAKANYALQIMAGNRDQAQLELAQAQAAAQQKAQERQLDMEEINLLMGIPEGQSFEFNGKKYTGMKKQELEALSNAEMISLMKTIPYGETETMTIGGNTYTISGLDRNNPNVKVIETTDASGNVIITQYDIDKKAIVGQVSAGKVGRAGGAGTNVTLNMQNEQRSGLNDAVSRLNASRGSDGYYNSNLVAAEMQNYAIQNPGKASQFWDVVKPFINPNDMPGLQAQQSKLTVEEQVENLFK